jgi:hypothetical protein
VPIHVAITMRSEYLGACTLIDGLPEVINRGLYLTPRMSREECRHAIVGPAEVCGFGIEDRLVNKRSTTSPTSPLGSRRRPRPAAPARPAPTSCR